MINPEDLYAKMELQLQRQLPFAAYRKPGTATVTMLFQEDNTTHYVNDYSESGFVFARFNNEQQPLLIPGAHYVSCNDHQHKPEILKESPISYPDSGKAAHLELVSKGIEAIEKGLFKKVVLSRKAEVPVPNPSGVQLFRKLLANYPEAFGYLWFHPVTGLWLGATPETLLKLNSNRFETMSLAGTQKFKGTTAVPWSEKEREEQQMVTDFIVHRLQNLTPELNVSDVYTVKAGNLLHLRTHITGIIQNSEFRIQNLIKALHPTPAVCGYPREAAKRFILQHENYDRLFYTGFLGELNFSAASGPDSEQRSSIYVNLRCMQLSGRKAVLYIGGGINKGSVPEREWRETVNKAQTMQNILIDNDEFEE